MARELPDKLLVYHDHDGSSYHLPELYWNKELELEFIGFWTDEEAPHGFSQAEWDWNLWDETIAHDPMWTLEDNYSNVPHSICAECDGPAFYDYLCPTCRMATQETR